MCRLLVVHTGWVLSHKVNDDTFDSNRMLQIELNSQGMTSVYRNIQNVVVKLVGESEGKGNHSLLLNCHYDSVPGSPGMIQLKVSLMK